MKTYLAVDIGASSGRHILGWLEDGKLKLKEIYRFKNGAKDQNGHLCWDIDRLESEVIDGIAACETAPESVAVDTWAVDYVLLGKNGERICPAVAYRDSRTETVPDELEKTVPFAWLYGRTGIQMQKFNTVYQLAAQKKEMPDVFEKAEKLLMIPDYLAYRLSGVAVNEYTNASTTAMVSAEHKTWDKEIIARMGLPEKIFGALHKPGEALGGLTERVKEKVGFDLTVRLAASHDTASAFLAVPAKDENAVFLSSGTWSLIGVELKAPVTNDESRAQNFTNEGGYEYRYRYLKNIMGLWMLQNMRQELGDENSFDKLTELAQSAADYKGRVDVNAECFLAPKNMCAAVKNELMKQGFKEPTVPEMLSCVYHSLAESYAETIKALEKLTGKVYTSLNIVGGGSRDEYLNKLTAKACKLPVYAGPTEGTAIGNLIVQMIADGELASVQQARDVIRDSFEIKIYEP